MASKDSNKTEGKTPAGDSMSDRMKALDADVAVKVFGPDPQVLERLGHALVGELEHVPGVADLQAEVLFGAAQLQIDVDRAEIARFGLKVADVQHEAAFFLGVDHLKRKTVAADFAGVADLPALLAVEARPVEQQGGALARGQLPGGDHRVVLHPADHPRGHRLGPVLGHIVGRGQVALHRGDRTAFIGRDFLPWCSGTPQRRVTRLEDRRPRSDVLV